MFDFVRTFGNDLTIWVLIPLLALAGLWFCVRTKFVQFRMFGEGVRQLLRKPDRATSSISPLQAFCVSVAAHVGAGNIAGVAIALVAGGPGAIFWMWVMSLIGMAASFVENTLGQTFKTKDENGIYRGGPAFYIEKGLKLKWLGFLFSVIITVTFGFVFNSLQANTIALAFNNAFNVPRVVIGALLAVLACIIIFGGIRRIAGFAEKLVMILGVAYLAVAIIVIVFNVTSVPAVLQLIVANAFGGRQIAGGAFAAMFMEGVRRGLFSNEAGMGSTPNAASVADVKHPARQGLVQMIGVFVDTIVICTATAFIILLPYVQGHAYEEGVTGVVLTQSALNFSLGSLSAALGAVAYGFVAICILLFSFSSILGNYYYGESNIKFLKGNKLVLGGFRVLVLAMVFLGATAQLSDVWAFSNLFMALMAIVNLVAILWLGKYAFAILADYQAQRRAGIAEPVFHASTIPGLTGAECWEADSLDVELADVAGQPIANSNSLAKEGNTLVATAAANTKISASA